MASCQLRPAAKEVSTDSHIVRLLLLVHRACLEQRLSPASSFVQRSAYLMGCFLTCRFPSCPVVVRHVLEGRPEISQHHPGVSRRIVPAAEARKTSRDQSCQGQGDA